MSNNYPPDYSGDPVRGGASDGPPEMATDNPYLRHAQPAPPDLDAAAPTLTVNEVRQLNRKALFFLGGILLLLLVMAFWFMHSLSNREKKQSKQGPQEVVTTPDLPQQAPVMPADAVLVPNAQPVDVVENAPPLPPPPASPSSYDDDGMSGSTVSAAPAPPAPTLAERRMNDGLAGAYPGQQPGGPNGVAAGAAPVATAETSKARSTAKLLNNPDALMIRGTYIRCVLETRIITDIPGFTSCLVSEPVYSVNGRSLLLPRGTKLLGQYGNQQIGRGRVGVIWDRAITPVGLDITMASPGTDNLGGAGHPGDYNAHWASRIGSAVMISMISDLFKYMGERHGPESNVVYPQSGVIVTQPYQSNTAQTVQELARQAIQESSNRRPTVTINQGSVLNVYVSQDVDFTSALRGR